MAIHGTQKGLFEESGKNSSKSVFQIVLVFLPHLLSLLQFESHSFGKYASCLLPPSLPLPKSCFVQSKGPSSSSSLPPPAFLCNSHTSVSQLSPLRAKGHSCWEQKGGEWWRRDFGRGKRECALPLYTKIRRKQVILWLPFQSSPFKNGQKINKYWAFSNFQSAAKKREKCPFRNI